MVLRKNAAGKMYASAVADTPPVISSVTPRSHVTSDTVGRKVRDGWQAGQGRFVDEVPRSEDNGGKKMCCCMLKASCEKKNCSISCTGAKDSKPRQRWCGLGIVATVIRGCQERVERIWNLNLELECGIGGGGVRLDGEKKKPASTRQTLARGCGFLAGGEIVTRTAPVVTRIRDPHGLPNVTPTCGAYLI